MDYRLKRKGPMQTRTFLKLFACFCVLSGCLKNNIIIKNQRSIASEQSTEKRQLPYPTPRPKSHYSECWNNKEYTLFPKIVAHGNLHDQISWSSEDDDRVQEARYRKLLTKRKGISMRILAHPSPGRGIDSRGKECANPKIDYTKLQMIVSLREEGSENPFTYFKFDNIPVNGCSTNHFFPISDEIRNSNRPIIVEVSRVQWDWACTAYTIGGDPDVPQCPWDLVWPNDCLSYSLQIK